MNLNGEPIQYVNEWTYLGTTIVAGKEFSFSAAISKPNDLVQMYLLYSNCIPTLTYAAEVKQYKCNDMTDCNTAVNDAIRRIFSYNRWESPRGLRQALGLPGLYEIFASRKKNFEAKCLRSQNRTVSFLMTI